MTFGTTCGARSILQEGSLLQAFATSEEMDTLKRREQVSGIGSIIIHKLKYVHEQKAYRGVRGKENDPVSICLASHEHTHSTDYIFYARECT